MKLTKEIGDYLVYSDGKVVSYNLYKKSFYGKEMKPYNRKDGYQSITLRINKKAYKCSLHRLVAECFIPNPENKPCVNHIDCNPSNNNVENLEWATYSENIKHAYDNNRHKLTKLKLSNLRKGKPAWNTGMKKQQQYEYRITKNN